MLLNADTDRRRKMKQEDDEAREAREAFQKKCQERAEQLRGLIGAIGSSMRTVAVATATCGPSTLPATRRRLSASCL